MPVFLSNLSLGKYMHLKVLLSVLVSIGSVAGSGRLVVGNDACSVISVRVSGVNESFCDSSRGICSDLFWNSIEKNWLVDSPKHISGLVPVSCAEAVNLAASHRIYSSSLIINWNEVHNAVLSILDLLRDEILPAALSIPVTHLSEFAIQSVRKQFWRIQGATGATRRPVGLPSHSLEYIATCPAWAEWNRLMKEWLSAISVRDLSDNHNDFFEKIIAPFLHLHRDIVLNLIPASWAENKDVTSPFIRSFFQENPKNWFPSDFFFNIDSVDLSDVNDDSSSPSELFRAVMERLEIVSSTDTIVRDKEIFERFESVLIRGQFDTSFCASAFMQSLAAFTFRACSVPQRRVRLIAHIANACKASSRLADRHALIPWLFDSFNGPYGNTPDDSQGSVSISIPPNPLSLTTMALEDPTLELFRFPVKIESDGPTLWIAKLINHYFSVNSAADQNLFEFSDDSSKFIKPEQYSFNESKFRAAGRVIGLAIRYKVTMGIKLTPLSFIQLAPPQLIEEDFDLEIQSAIEDPVFVKALIQDEDKNDIHLVEFVRDALYQKSVDSIRSQMLVIAEGIRDVIPPGTLSLFTLDELRSMIWGRSDLPAQILLNGICFLNRESSNSNAGVFDWLVEIIQESNDDFRFAFNEFVTGSRQPPVVRSDQAAWISVSVNPVATIDSFPTSETSISTLYLPLYLSKDILRSKLELVVYANQEL